MILLAYWLLPILFGALSAVHVGDIVWVQKNHQHYLSGRIGLVICLKHRAVVYVFRNNLLEQTREGRDILPLNGYFTTHAFDVDMLTVVDESFWKPELRAPNNGKIEKVYPSDLCGYEPAVKAHLPDAYNQFSLFKKSFEKIEAKFGLFNVSEEGISVELIIISVWMNRVFQVSFLKTLPDLFPFKRDTFVRLQELEGDSAQYNGQIGIVFARQKLHTKVMILKSEYQDFQIINVNDWQMRLVNEEDWHKEVILADSARRGGLNRSGYTVFAYGRSNLDNEAQFKLTQIVHFIRDRCKEDGIFLFNNGVLALKVRLLGAWINLNYGWHGMAFVIKFKGLDEFNDVKDALDLLWVGIGAWTR